MGMFAKRHDQARVRATVRAKPARMTARATADSKSLLSIGALVSGILLSSAVIVWTATRKLPDRR